jgi:putative hemolysin
MPGGILSDAVEIGRACVAPSHRNGRVLHLLWRGLARYLQWNGKRHLFGCCSVPGLDPQLARDMWGALHGRGVVHETMHVRPRPFARAIADDGRTVPPEGTEAVVTLPPLFEAYLSLGARICGAPAFDREFGTTDFLVLLDTQTMSPRAYQSFFG